jgi:hypothetical protein
MPACCSPETFKAQHKAYEHCDASNPRTPTTTQGPLDTFYSKPSIQSPLKIPKSCTLHPHQEVWVLFQQPVQAEGCDAQDLLQVNTCILALNHLSAAVDGLQASAQLKNHKKKQQISPGVRKPDGAQGCCKEHAGQIKLLAALMPQTWGVVAACWFGA